MDFFGLAPIMVQVPLLLIVGLSIAAGWGMSFWYHHRSEVMELRVSVRRSLETSERAIGSAERSTTMPREAGVS